ncbi:ABC transporter permease [Hyphomicrobium sp. CS1BSMeth3]|uniref:ABC transporter permease n=1 Tax=Hyphomicrobium sp. CS1BSMeth3 TaxID=1892844 RepID=UPI000931C475|nr:ABC transporter permease [Hyphomicrobium sp. CS1BSMeth3]
MALTAFLLKRLSYAAVLVLAVLVLNFLLIRLAPGDPIETLAGQMGGMTEEIRAELQRAYGLDKPLPAQLGIYLSRAISGDLGHSYFFNLPVTQLILERVPATLLLVMTALFLAVLAGTTLGVMASRRPNGLLSQIITVVSVVGYSAPVFWTGMLLIILFASIIPILPVSGMRAAVVRQGVFADMLDVAHHLVLPSLSLAIVYLAQYGRLTRASMLDVLGADYIRTARAKGLTENTVYFRHALRNALLPVITIVGLQFGNMLAGAIVVETVFNWPGLGRLAFDSVLRRDYPTLLGLLFFSSLLVIVVNQLTDMCYRLADPRIRT